MATRFTFAVDRVNPGQPDHVAANRDARGAHDVRISSPAALGATAVDLTDLMSRIVDAHSVMPGYVFQYAFGSLISAGEVLSKLRVLWCNHKTQGFTDHQSSPP